MTDSLRRALPVRTARPGIVFLVSFLAIALLGVLWALASPIYSVPDENAHGSKAIAQARGQIIGYNVDGVRHIVVDLPDGYRYSPQVICFVYQPTVSANCGAELGDPGGTPWFATWVGAYNPTYYAIVSWPSLLFDGSAGIYAMRIVSALVGALFLALAFMAALSVRGSPWMPFALMFLVSPMIIYFTGAVNPQGLEVAVAAALWVALLRLLQSYTPGSPPTLSRGALWAIIVPSAILLANARALGPLWVVVIVGTSLLLSPKIATITLFTTGRNYLWMGIIAVGGLFSVWWTLFGGSLSGQAQKGDALLVGGTFLQGFAFMFRHVLAFIQQAVGYFGWFDTLLPPITYAAYFVAFSLLVIVGLVAVRRRGVVRILTVMGVALLVPALVQAYSVSQTGIIWQGRYGLFLYIAVPLIAALVLSERDSARTMFIAPRLTAVGVFLLTAYGIAAYALVLRRYTVGIDEPVTQMVFDVEWQPPLGWMVLIPAFVVVIVAFGVWVVRQSFVHSAAFAEDVSTAPRTDVRA